MCYNFHIEAHFISYLFCVNVPVGFINRYNSRIWSQLQKVSKRYCFCFRVFANASWRHIIVTRSEAHFRKDCSIVSVLKLASSTLRIWSTLLKAIVPGSVFATASSIAITRQVWNELTSSWCFAIDSNVSDAGLLQSSSWTKYQSVNAFHEQFDFVLSNLFEVAEFLRLRVQTNFKRWALLAVALA